MISMQEPGKRSSMGLYYLRKKVRPWNHCERGVYVEK